MNTNNKIADLLRQLATEFDALDLAKPAPAQEAQTWVKIKDFCESHELGESTVRRYIREGMPHKTFGNRNVRINVAAAEAWLEDRGVAYKNERAA